MGCTLSVTAVIPPIQQWMMCSLFLVRRKHSNSAAGVCVCAEPAAKPIDKLTCSLPTCKAMERHRQLDASFHTRCLACIRYSGSLDKHEGVGARAEAAAQGKVLRRTSHLPCGCWGGRVVHKELNIAAQWHGTQ